MGMSSYDTPSVVISTSGDYLDAKDYGNDNLEANSCYKNNDHNSPQADLIEASAKNPSVLLELDMDGNVKHLGKAWESIIGTKIQKILNKPISNIILGNEDDRNVFNNAIGIMTIDDESYRVRFVVATNDPKPETTDSESLDLEEYEAPNDQGSLSSLSTNGEMIELEGQGILIHDGTNLPTHSMWILKPFYANALNVQLPTKLAETLGFGADIFTSYLSALSEAGVINEDEVPAPPQVLCRICEQQVPSWWLEKHSELCFNEHKCESEVQEAHDTLLEHKKIISTIVDSLHRNQINIDENHSDNYKGLPLPKVSPNDSPASRTATPLARTRARSGSIFGTLRFPFKTLARLTELCEQALSINPSEFNEETDTFEFSPNTKHALEIVSASEIPASSDPCIMLLSKDTEKLVEDKVNAVSRLNSSLLYSQKIKDEVDGFVVSTISETIKNIRNQTYDVVPPGSSSSEKLNTPVDKRDTGVKLVYPKPTSVQSNIFTDAYLKTDSLPSPSRESLREALIETRGQYSPSRSITPNETLQKNDDGHNPNLSELSIKSPILTPQRKTSPGAPPGYQYSPMSSIQRNAKSSGVPIYDSFGNTPASSPLILAHEPFDHFEKRSSGGDNYLSLSSGGSAGGHSISRPPLSPLLVAVPATKSNGPSIKDYEVLKALSKGAFGSVYLARRKITGDYFAIKVLKKADMIAKNQVTNVKSERAVMMAQSESPYVAKLYSSFQSKDYLFLVMEYLPGGDFSTLVKMLGNLPDEWGKQYIAEVVVGVDDLHKKGIVHHDLKPDNLLIASNGHLKLTDFGLSRMGLIRRQERAHTHKHSIPGDDVFAQAISTQHRKNSSVTPFSLTSSGTPTGNDFSSAGSSPTSSFFENMVNAEMKKEERSGSGSSVMDSPLLRPLHRSSSHTSFALPEENSPSFGTPTTRDLALYDPENASFNKKFVGTPDYLSPETIRGNGESEASDWWSVGCILFEFLFGYPPFHAKIPDQVFANILNGKVDWPNLSPQEEIKYCSPEAKDLIKKLLNMNPEERLGANGADEIKEHPYFEGINWDELYNVDGSFVPVVEHPESTDYFEARGADVQDFPHSDGSDSEADDSMGSKNGGHRLSTQINNTTTLGSPSTTISPTSKHLSLAIPSHMRERRPSKLNENAGEFGSFQFRNLPALDKANKDVINRIKAEHLEHRGSMSSSSSDSGTRSRTYSISSTTGLRRAVSPSASIIRTRSPSRMSISSGNAIPQSIPLQDRLNSSSSVVSISSGDEIGTNLFIERSGRSSPRSDSGSPSTKAFSSPQTPTTQIPINNQQSTPRSSRSNLFQKALSDFSPSSSDTEDSRTSALRRIRRRRQSSKFSDTSSSRLPILDILLCEPIPILRYSLKKDLENLGCAVVAVAAGDEIIRRATGEVKFDLIITALKLPKLGAVDIAKLLTHTSSINSDTPIVALTVYYKEAKSANVFSDVLEKPVGTKQLKAILEKHCRLKIDQSEQAVSDTEALSDVDDLDQPAKPI